MTIYDLIKSIGTRLVRSHLHIAWWACISLVLCLMGQGLYLLTALIATTLTDPWFGFAAQSYRFILFATAVVLLCIGFVVFEYRFFRGTCHDIHQYFATRHPTSRAP